MLDRLIGKMIVVSFPAHSSWSRFSENILAVFTLESADFPAQQDFLIFIDAVQYPSDLAVIHGFGLPFAPGTVKDVSGVANMETNVLVRFQSI